MGQIDVSARVRNVRPKKRGYSRSAKSRRRRRRLYARLMLGGCILLAGLLIAFLTPNPYSRPGEPLPEVKNIFIHYTANPGTTAEQNRSYFENLGITGETSASAHFVIGFDGTILQCIPLDEIGYAVKTRNYDSVSIECCYQSEDGSFTEATYASLIRLTAWLLEKYGLTPADVLRHYDVGGKKCPLYFVENEDAWEGFRQDLSDYIRKS